MPWNRVLRRFALYLVLFFVAISLINYLAATREPVEELRYTQFVQAVNEDRIAEVTVTFQQGGTGAVNGTLDDGTRFHSIISTTDTRLLERLEEKVPSVQLVSVQESGRWTIILASLLPILILVVAFFFIIKRSQGAGNQMMQFGKSRARMHTGQDKVKVTFDDVAGIDEVLEELKEIVDFLKSPRRYLELGARIPKGLLLLGAPGTGKTHVARAVAGEAGVPFFSISGSDFVEMFVGVGASRVRDLFEQAKKNSPCIVFIDEIDAVGRQRGAGHGGGHDEREQTLNQLLTDMDGFGVNEGIIIMAATNRPDVLDPALLRPGRFDRQVVIDKPDLSGREEVLKVHTRGKKLGDDVDLRMLARRTPGFTPADLENLINEAALLAARRRRERVAMEDLEDGIDRIVGGGPEKKSRIISDREKKIIAYHEAAHALVASLLHHTDPVHKISIIPRGGVLGYVLQLPTEDRYLISRSEILDRVITALAGRAAEDLVFSDVSTGAHDDLEMATKLVRRMIMEFGMSDKLGPLTFGDKQDSPFLGRDLTRGRNFSDKVAAAIDREIRDILSRSYTRAKETLKENRSTLDRIAQALLAKETLEGEELDQLLGLNE